jgi:hypothetical protein
MKIKCLKCEKVKELTPEELQEVGEFVEKRKLRAVGFLKVLSMDLREENLCTNGKNHEFEFEKSFDNDVHLVAKNINDASSNIVSSEKEIVECESKIAEFIAKKEAANKMKDEQKVLLDKGKEILKEIAYIPDPKLWS